MNAGKFNAITAGVADRTAEKEIHARHRWHAHQMNIGQKEDIQNCLTRLGFNRWNNGVCHESV